MTGGTNVTPNFLWKLRFKINTPDGSLNFVLHLADMTEAAAKAAALKIAEYYRYLIPSTCEIKRCTISKSNTTKDSQIITGAIGDGRYLNVVLTTPTVYNQATDTIKVRFEDNDGSGLTLQIGPVPDTIITGGEIPLPISSVTDMSAADPTSPIVTDVVYATAFNGLMLLIGKYCARVKSSTNNPGGTYEYSKFKAAHVIGVGKKKSGKILVR